MGQWLRWVESIERGFFFGRPLPATDPGAMVGKWNTLMK